MLLTKKNLTVPRLRTILQRQRTGLFGKDYEPSIRATREEAPSISKAFTLRSRLVGRDIHLLSQNELATALVALYIPSLVDLHEQKMLHTGPTTHPLYGRPGVNNLNLPSLSGTLRIAERLGYTHPIVHGSISPKDSQKRTFAFPYIGDLLLILSDPAGEYCINWNIKGTMDDFRKRGPNKSKLHEKFPQKEEMAALGRHQIESTYYSDGNIRTVEISGKQFDSNVIANLQFLHAYNIATISIDQGIRNEMLATYMSAFSSAVLPSQVMHLLMKRYRVCLYTCQTVLYQAIWQRKIRVDLYRPILPDQPLVAEKIDFLNTIEHMYCR